MNPFELLGTMIGWVLVAVVALGGVTLVVVIIVAIVSSIVTAARARRSKAPEPTRILRYIRPEARK